MQKIIPHLWFDKEAKEAANFYTSLFSTGSGQGPSQVKNVVVLHDTPSGDCDVVSFELWGYSLMAISAGPLFKLNPSISFMVNFDPSKDSDAVARIDKMWEGLILGGKILMPLDQYPFSKKYGWVEDKYGVSWQLILTDPNGEERPAIIPSLMFVGDVCGKAEEASDFYISLFKDSKRGVISHYPPGMPPEKEENIMFTDFKLHGQWFVAMDSANKHEFAFNEAVSLIVNCDDQAEIDYYWEKLSAVPEAEQCGWLKDKYGVSWQIVPREMEEMMDRGTPDQVDRLTRAFLPMKKFNIAVLKEAFEGK